MGGWIQFGRSKAKLFLREEKDFALPRLFIRSGSSASQEGAGGMRGGRAGWI